MKYHFHWSPLLIYVVGLKNFINWRYPVFSGDPQIFIFEMYILSFFGNFFFAIISIFANLQFFADSKSTAFKSLPITYHLN